MKQININKPMFFKKTKLLLKDAIYCIEIVNSIGDPCEFKQCKFEITKSFTVMILLIYHG
jgi:hypothetical protein